MGTCWNRLGEAENVQFLKLKKSLYIARASFRNGTKSLLNDWIYWRHKFSSVRNEDMILMLQILISYNTFIII